MLGWVGTGWLDGLLREAGMAEAAWSAGGAMAVAGATLAVAALSQPTRSSLWLRPAPRGLKAV